MDNIDIYSFRPLLSIWSILFAVHFFRPRRPDYLFALNARGKSYGNESSSASISQYFKKHNHAVIASSPVIPHDDPTLLFINAGMNQFKDVFLGASARDYTRAATSQKCIRVGGQV